MRRTRVWLPFSMGVAVVLASLVWLTMELVRLERANQEARIATEHESAMRVALWRLDSWFAPRLAAESARMESEYASFMTQPAAFTIGSEPLQCGPVQVPSPLLTFSSSFIRLHFEIDPRGVATSPQVPQGATTAMAEGVGWLAASEDPRRRDLTDVSARLGATPAAAQSIEKVEACVIAFVPPTLPPVPQPERPDLEGQLDTGPRQKALSKLEFQKRSQAYASNVGIDIEPQTLETDGPGPATVVGPMVPLWLGEASSPPLVFARRVVRDGETWVQGFLCDWPALEEELLAEVADYFPDAVLQPIDPAVPLDLDEGAPNRLGAVPVLLAAAPRSVPGAAVWNASRLTLLLTWGFALAALLAVGLTLQWSVVFAEKRTRFASAVTHELRTPLTTFRMYAEMLADGMVPDEARRAEYLDTLKHESERLSRLVENVLAYARLERGGTTVSLRPTSLGDLMASIRPALEVCAAGGGMTLAVDVAEPDVRLTTDAEAAGRILCNLVENATKYAAAADDRRVELHTRVEASTIQIEVRDHGPGVESQRRRTIFTPYERGGDDVRTTAGVGLGLALSRGLARRLGGALDLVPSADGACFRLTLPRDRE